ncbi:hypothetical protein RchiOBHm_Chr1g0336431 [Rosa chinensis]|uniref:Uncharacterized protein n=1 Tax=Rosa chinensis TaxID=74649 RepID=A0A2P6SCM7_ROSCH|nr:hypothetical protein RchiOBHm_Chr1g0336431 [Rosa chinensis]
MEFVNSVKKLQRREISSKRDRAITMSDARERFYNIHLQYIHGVCSKNYTMLYSISDKHVQEIKIR